MHKSSGRCEQPVQSKNLTGLPPPEQRLVAQEEESIVLLSPHIRDIVRAVLLGVDCSLNALRHLDPQATVALQPVEVTKESDREAQGKQRTDNP